MLLAGHFSVWAVAAGTVAMERRERERVRLQAVMPFITARKVKCLHRVRAVTRRFDLCAADGARVERVARAPAAAAPCVRAGRGRPHGLAIPRNVVSPRVPPRLVAFHGACVGHCRKRCRHPPLPDAAHLRAGAFER